MLKARFFSVILLLSLLSAIRSTAQETSPIIILRHDGVVTSAHWYADDMRVLTTSEDGFVRRWNADQPEPVWATDIESVIRGAHLSPDETVILIWTADGNVTLVDTATGEIISRLTINDQTAIGGAKWRSDGQTALVWTADRVVLPIIRSENNADAATISWVHDSTVLEAQWSSDESHVLTLEMNGTAHVWDAETGRELAAISLDDETLGVTWSDDLSRLLAWGGNNRVQIYETESGRGMRAFNHRTFVEGAIWNDNETRILSWGADDAVRIWNAATGDQIVALRHEDWVTGAMWNRDETRVLSWSFNSLWLWDMNGRLLQTFDHDALVSGAKWSADETRILSWSWDGTARIWAIIEQ